MVENFFKHYVYPVATLAGSIIGVGFLSLPYITLKIGIWPMLFYFAALTWLVVYIHLIFGEISLKTPDYKRFPGFVGFYLGRRAKAITLLSMIAGSFGVLLVYLIVGGKFLATILAPFFGGGELWYVLLYFSIGSLVVYFGIRAISKVEFWALVLLLTALCTVFIKGFWQIKLGNIFSGPILSLSDWKTMFLPYGAIIFSLWGVGLIPEIEEMLIGKKHLLKKIIIISVLIPAAMYLVFIFLILGISGSQTTESALPGLKNFLGQGAFLVALFLGLVSTFTAFIAQGILLKKTFVYDMQMREGTAWVFACFVPLILFLLGINSFIGLISFIGGILLGINGIFILLMYQKIGGRRIIIYSLTAVFILGMVYEIVYFIA